MRARYPDVVEHVVLLGGYDGKIEDVQAIVLLKGAMGDKLHVAFPGDPAGAWMFEEPDRKKLLHVRSIIWSYTMAIGNIGLKSPVIFDSAKRLRSART
ncbi:MAG TPA: hypothetical protein VIG51_06610 [Candidatus Baltobacteraceae bacterium]